jgi:hypothetical protein
MLSQPEVTLRICSAHVKCWTELERSLLLLPLQFKFAPAPHLSPFGIIAGIFSKN